MELVLQPGSNVQMDQFMRPRMLPALDALPVLLLRAPLRERNATLAAVGSELQALYFGLWCCLIHVVPPDR